MPHAELRGLCDSPRFPFIWGNRFPSTEVLERPGVTFANSGVACKGGGEKEGSLAVGLGGKDCFLGRGRQPGALVWG